VNSADAGGSSSTVTASHASQPRTINPSLLERSSESAALQSSYQQHPPKGKFTFETSLGRKPQNQTRLDAYVNNCNDSMLRSSLTNNRAANLTGAQDDARKQPGRNADVLSRAREYGMKIWALEKLQRMMATLFDADPDVPQHSHNTRSNATNATAGMSKHSRNADLSNLLRNERLNGPLDRDTTVASKDLVPFKGVFIYVRDMKEKCRPILVREYSKVTNREEGQWPQFRSVSQGKCPFVEEVVHSRRDQRARTHEKEGYKGRGKESQGTHGTRTMAAVEMGTNGVDKRVFAEVENGASRMSRSTREASLAKLFEPPRVVPAKRGSPADGISGFHNPHTNHGGGQRYFGGEPIASGVQPSNITSAIRSQMISSTAAAPGAKAGTSKEIYGLQRKILERTGPPPRNSVPQSVRVTDLAGASVTERTSIGERVPKRRLQEKLEVLGEEDASGSDEENMRRTGATRRIVYGRKLHVEDAKPGYCENCKDKFDDFDEVGSRRLAVFNPR
jgi:regulatory subunit for Cdc7p protein kinase